MPHSAALTPQELADICLGFLAENPGQLAEFMRVAGYSPTALRAAVGSEQLQLGLIDYFAQNEHLLLTLCTNRQLQPQHFMRVWSGLNPAG